MRLINGLELYSTNYSSLIDISEIHSTYNFKLNFSSILAKLSGIEEKQLHGFTCNIIKIKILNILIILN